MGRRDLIRVDNADDVIIDSDSAAEARYNALSGQLSENALAKLREAVKERKRQAAVAIDASNSELAVRTADIITQMIGMGISEEVIERVAGNINTPKDMLDYSKALNEFRNLMMKSQVESSDPEKANTKSNMKISLAFSNGKIAVSAENGG